jgi:hypothetical protein
MRSLFAKNLEVIRDGATGEDYQFIPEGTLTGSIVKADFEKLKEFEPIAVQVTQDLDSIVSRNDAAGLVKVAEVIAPYQKIAEKYEDDIPFARISIGKRLPLVNSASDSLDKAVELVAGSLYSKFDAAQKAIDEVTDIPRSVKALEDMRAEMGSAAESYKILKEKFGKKVSKKEMDDYAEKMPGIAAVKKELDAIENMLAEDQSKDFARLKQKQKYIKGGFWGSGIVMAEACRLDYKEGKARCNMLYDEISEFMKEFPQIWEKAGKIKKQNKLLEDGLCVMSSLSGTEPNVDSAQALKSVQNMLYSMPAPVDHGFTCIDRARDENIRLRSELQKAYSCVSSEIYVRAKAAFEQTTMPPAPDNIEALNIAVDYLNSSKPKLKVFGGVFDALGKKELVVESAAKLKKFEEMHKSLYDDMDRYAVIENAASNCRQKLSEAAGLFTNPGFIEHDFNRALALLDEKAPKLPGTALFRKITDEYINTAGAMQKLVHERLAQGIGSLVEIYATPIQLKGDIAADSGALNDRIDKINKTVTPLLSKSFSHRVPITVDKYSNKLQGAVQSFKASLGEIETAKARREDISRKLVLMKDALTNFDYGRIDSYSKWPDEASQTPYTADVVSEYSSIMKHLRSIAAEKVPISLSAFAHPAFDDSPPDKRRNLFEYVGSMPVLENPVLADLRRKLLMGEVHMRLSALEQSLSRIAGAELSPEEAKWVSQLGAEYRRDVADGYLSKAEQFNVNPESLARINRLFEKYSA